MTFQEFVVQALSEDTRFQNIDITEGSNIDDLVISVIEYLVDTNLDEDILDGIIDSLDIDNYADLSASELRRLAANNLIEIPVKNQTVGELRLYTSSPETMTLSSGNIFYAGSIECESTYDVKFIESDYSIIGGYYVTPPITILNTSGVSFSANAIGSMDNAPDSLVKIVHAAMTSGVEDRTSAQIYGLIKNSIAARQFMSPAGIQNTILKMFSGITRVEVVGQGEDEMLRDRLYNVTSPNAEIDIVGDFSGKIRGFIDEDPLSVYNNNRAYKVFVKDIGSELDSDSGIEFNQLDYIKVMENNDELSVTVSTDNILSETFSEGSELGGMTYDIDVSAEEDDLTLDIASVAGLVAGLNIKIISYDAALDKEPTKINVVRSISGTIVTLFASVGKDIDIANGTPYIEVVDSLGYFIGEGWVKGEDGLGLGKVITKESAMVVDDTLVLGMQNSEYGGNVILETVVRNGIDKFIRAVTGAITVKNVISSKDVAAEDEKVYVENTRAGYRKEQPLISLDPVRPGSNRVRKINTSDIEVL